MKYLTLVHNEKKTLNNRVVFGNGHWFPLVNIFKIYHVLNIDLIIQQTLGHLRDNRERFI